jgi:hypothetical protein
LVILNELQNLWILFPQLLKQRLQIKHYCFNGHAIRNRELQGKRASSMKYLQNLRVSLHQGKQALELWIVPQSIKIPTTII